MSELLAPAPSGLLQSGRGYLIDQSHPPIFIAAVLGVGEFLDHRVGVLEQDGRDVSPVVLESQSRTLVLNLYDPEPLTVQVVQHDGPFECATEIIGMGIGLGVLSEIRRTARILDLELTPLTDRFSRRLDREKATTLQTYALFRGDAAEKKARFAQVLRGMQAKHRREASLLRQLL
jgi:hypothetical protein